MKIAKSSMAAVACVILAFTSCKKEDEKKDEGLDGNVRQFNQDSQFLKTESDQADSDINQALEDVPGFGRLSNTLSSPFCGVTLDTSLISQKILFFNFDGITPCFSPSRTRSGQIKVQLTTGNLWSDINSVLTITYNNFKVTRLQDNRSLIFNGVKTLKNINGNDWFGFFAETSTLKYQERAFNIQVVFDNGALAVWNSARITEWAYDNDTDPTKIKFVFNAVGDTTLNGFNTVDSWGINRFNQPFTTYYSTPYVSNTYCGLWRPISGQLTHQLPSSSYILTLGVDQSGNPTPYQCAYGYKVLWSANGNTFAVVLSY